MARAPARLAPLIKIWLRRLELSLVTSASPSRPRARKPRLTKNTKKFGHQPGLDDGPSLSELHYYAAITRSCRRLRQLC